jgi:hypothetical protein
MAVHVRQANLTPPVGGTVTVIVTPNPLPISFPNSPIVWIEGHAGGILDSVSGAVVPANVLQVGGPNNAGNIQAIKQGANAIGLIENTVIADVALNGFSGGVADVGNNATRGLSVCSFLFNPAVPGWDRWRDAVLGNAVSGVGISASDAYGEYLSTAPAPASGQYSSFQQDYAGNIFTKHIRRSQVSVKSTTIANSAVAATIITAPGAGIFADMSRLILSVVPLAAAAVPISFTATLSDGTNNFIYDLQADQLGTAVLVSNPTQILDLNFDPSLPATTAATAWTITLSAATVTVHITAVAILQKVS